GYLLGRAMRQILPRNSASAHTGATHPIFLGDVVLTGTGAEEDEVLLEQIVRDVFEQREFVVQVMPHGRGPWQDSFARFTDVFDAATWCMLLVSTLRPGAGVRLQSREPERDGSARHDRGGDASW
ncbi:hypothetical protein, partial [Microbacterium gubbeenense]